MTKLSDEDLQKIRLECDVIVKNRIDELKKEAFVNADAGLHKVMQQQNIDRMNRLSALGFDLLKQLIIWGVIVFAAMASYLNMFKVGGK